MVRMVGAKSGPCQHVCGFRVTIASTERTNVSRETSGRFRGVVKRFGVVRFGMRSGGALGRIGRGRVRMRLCRARSCRAMRGLFGRVGLVGFVAMVFRCVPPLAVCGAKGAFESSPPSAPYALGWARMLMASCAFFGGGCPWLRTLWGRGMRAHSVWVVLRAVPGSLFGVMAATGWVCEPGWAQMEQPRFHFTPDVSRETSVRL